MTTKLETIASLISTSSGSPKCYPYERPNGTNECVVYKQISNVPIRSHDGVLLYKTRIQLTCWSDTLAKCRTLALKMFNLFENNKTNFVLSINIDDIIDKELESGLFKSYLDFYIY